MFYLSSSFWSFPRAIAAHDRKAPRGTLGRRDQGGLEATTPPLKYIQRGNPDAHAKPYRSIDRPRGIAHCLRGIELS